MSNLELYTSLADLAGSDTTEIAVLRSRLQAAGIYLVSFTEVGMTEALSDDPTKAPRVNLNFIGVVDLFQPLEGADTDEGMKAAEDMVGKRYMQRETIWASDLKESIGLLKGRYQSAHLAASGVLGGIAGTTGWLDGVVGQRVGIRVRHRQVGDDTRVYYDWLGSKALAKAGIAWDEIGRDPVDVHGNPIEIVTE